MYIKFSKKLDLIRERDQFKRNFEARQVLYDSQIKNYRDAEDLWESIIESEIENEFKEYIKNLPYLRIFVRAIGTQGNSMKITIIYNNEADSNSPKWRYDVDLAANEDDEGVHIVTSTPAMYWDRINFAQIDMAEILLNSAKLIRAFADFDWQRLVDSALETIPKKKNYVGITEPKYDIDYQDPGYNRKILEAQIEEIVGTDNWLVVDNYGAKKYIKVIDNIGDFIQYKCIYPNLLNTRELNEELESEPNADLKDDFFEMFKLLEPLEIIPEDDLRDIASSYDG